MKLKFNEEPARNGGLFLCPKSKILEKSFEVFQRYFNPNFKLGEYYKSPLRVDKNPSFNLFNNGETILFKDWGGKSGNCIDYVMELYGLNYKEAINKICKELDLEKEIEKPKSKSKKVKKKQTKKEYKLIPILNIKNGKPYYTSTDTWYWGKINVEIELVRKHNILSAKLLYINNKLIARSGYLDPLYIEYEKYNGIVYKKSYYPLTKNKSLKWRSDMFGVSHKILHNINRIPEKGERLIITKSFKDCIILDSIGFNSISTQGEDMPIDEDILNNLKKRFKHIYLLYDNDYSKEENTGLILGKKYSEMYGLIHKYIPSSYACTDLGELALQHNKKIVKDIICKILK